MSAILITAAESSKVPFFILGGALAIYAVVLAAIGMNRPSFPGDARGQRAVIGVTLVMIVLAIGAAVLTS
jgi:hypothetical protein